MSRASIVAKSVFGVALTSSLVLAQNNDVSVEVKCHKSIVVLGEPLFVGVIVKNNSPKELKLIHHNAPTVNPSELSVVDLMFGETREDLRTWSDGFRVIRRTRPRTLHSDESTAVDLVILFNRKDGFFARKPGRYWIAARVVIAENGFTELVSESVSIDILEPQPVDESVWQWLKENEEHYGRLIQVPTTVELPEEFVDACHKLCEASDSVFVEYLALSLSRWYQDKGADREEARHYAQIAQRRASSELIKRLAVKMSP